EPRVGVHRANRRARGGRGGRARAGGGDGMRGVIRAELLRLGKRASLVLIAGAVPILAIVFFGLASASTYDPPPFDPAEIRQMLIDSGYVIGLPPDEAERQLNDYIENERRNFEQMLENTRRYR